ncbi:MAG: hypothetical protein R3C68_05250 [Myxococcota bacterium]
MSLPRICSTHKNYSSGYFLGARRHFSIGLFIASGMLMASPGAAWAHAETSLSDYETILPHATQAELPRYERQLLVAYLDAPTNIALAKWLAFVHLLQLPHERSSGAELRRLVITQYFLHRATTLGADERWIRRGLRKTQRRLDKVMQSRTALSTDEDHPAHQFYREAFHYKEENRYRAEKKLLNDFVRQPNNVYTAFALTALNLWVGGEADYDDPNVLYHFVLGSFFSLHTMELAHRIEDAWTNGSSSTPRFRVASILGGFSALQRRWLAALHGNSTALALIDDEHRQWRLIHRAFHAFTVGIPFFEEPENFEEGLFAIVDGFAHCQDEPVRTCLNRPRFAYNNLAFVLTLVDFLVKAGDLPSAQQTLQYRFSPAEAENWAAWDLGREAWLHRENNLNEIAALYQNDDPTDDPLHFQMKRRKWGTNTTTCQICHQTQGLSWSDEEFNNVLLPPEGVATVGTWPEVSTTWYAEPVAP